MTLRFRLFSAPRTKKTSQRVVYTKGANGGRGFTKVLPSEAYCDWFADAMTQAPLIRRELERQGAVLPIPGTVNVRALFYRDADRGDAAGYYQGLADWMQEPRQKNGRTLRNGAGIIRDDNQVASWDGSRLLKDSACPRIEVELTVLGPGQGELGLEGAEG